MLYTHLVTTQTTANTIAVRTKRAPTTPRMIPNSFSKKTQMITFRFTAEAFIHSNMQYILVCVFPRWLELPNWTEAIGRCSHECEMEDLGNDYTSFWVYHQKQLLRGGSCGASGSIPKDTCYRSHYKANWSRSQHIITSVCEGGLCTSQPEV